MQIRVDQQNGAKVAVVESSDLLIRDVQDALDLMATIRYSYDCDHIVLQQSNLTEQFFDLKTKLAGEILQKFVNYQVKMAIVGRYNGYSSKSLRDFIYECNQGKQFFFVEDEDSAIRTLHALR